MNVGTRLTKSGAFAHMTKIDHVINDFVQRYGDEGTHHDPVVAYAAKASNLRMAIDRATQGRDESGKMFAMESCVRTSSKTALYDNLVADLRLVEEAISDFDWLHDVIHQRKPWGIGDLTVYNVTFRIAAFGGGAKPTRFVYLHAGPAKGWRALTGDRTSRHKVSIESVPTKLRARLSPAKIEDLLCEYRELLNPSFLL